MKCRGAMLACNPTKSPSALRGSLSVYLVCFLFLEKSLSFLRLKSLETGLGSPSLLFHHFVFNFNKPGCSLKVSFCGAGLWPMAKKEHCLSRFACHSMIQKYRSPI